MTLDAIFRQGVFPPWPEKFRDVSPTGWVGQIWRERQAALKIAQVPHEQNEMVRIAKVTGKQPVLAEPAVRQSVARNQQRELAQIHHRINAVAEQAAAARAKLKLILFEPGGRVVFERVVERLQGFLLQSKYPRS
jgi:hypothetical protein